MSPHTPESGETGLTLPALVLAETSPLARRLARSLLLIFVLLIIALGFTPWQQNVQGMGRVVAYTPVERQQIVQSPIDGRVMQWFVQEGTRVQAGQKLAELSDNDPELLNRLSLELRTVKDRIATIETRVDTLDQRVRMAGDSRTMAVTAADSRIQMAEERLRAAEHALDAATAAQLTANLNFDRQSALLAKGLTSRRNLELAQLEVTQRRTEVDRAKAALKAARHEVDALRSDRRKTEADAGGSVEKARAELKKSQEELAYAVAEKLKLETRLARQRNQMITAPRDGTVLRLAVSNNAEQIKMGDPLLVLIPDTQERAVELWVDGNDVPLITPGRAVRLQFEGYPAIQFSGWPEVAVGTFGGRVSLIDATDNGQGKFRLLVAPDFDDEPWPDDRFLRQGVRANGWVLLNTVPLGYEFWRIFNGFPPIIMPTHPPLDKKPSGGKAKSADGGKEEK